MSDKGRRDGTRPGPFGPPPGLPGGRLPGRAPRARWLTARTAERLVTGEQVRLADAAAADTAVRLAWLLAAAGGRRPTPGAWQPVEGSTDGGRGGQGGHGGYGAAVPAVDPVREEAALAAFRAARAAASPAPARRAGRTARAGRGGPWALGWLRTDRNRTESGVAVRAPRARGLDARGLDARGAESEAGAEFGPGQGAGRRGPRPSFAAMASVVALSGIAVAVAAATGRAGLPGPGGGMVPADSGRPGVHATTAASAGVSGGPATPAVPPTRSRESNPGGYPTPSAALSPTASLADGGRTACAPPPEGRSATRAPAGCCASARSCDHRSDGRDRTGDGSRHHDGWDTRTYGDGVPGRGPSGGISSGAPQSGGEDGKDGADDVGGVRSGSMLVGGGSDGRTGSGRDRRDGGAKGGPDRGGQDRGGQDRGRPDSGRQDGGRGGRGHGTASTKGGGFTGNRSGCPEGADAARTGRGTAGASTPSSPASLGSTRTR
ncbi:hypothetical protein [Actinacidiphila yeochonensis]|uniref:hypothetical protein n=1 Tax=Actinacidiphila yeochonensis TaxID=89050 RepID=UPI0005613AE5|nr:hypothetical protein [Actinacidiphila yeochonensis]